DLALRPRELERGTAGSRLLARVLTARRRIFLAVRHHDVRTEVFGDDLRAGERTLREELVVDFDGASFLHAFAGRLPLLLVLWTFVRFLAADEATGSRRRRRRRTHRTSRSTGT